MERAHASSGTLGAETRRADRRASRRGGPRHPSGVVVERSASDRATRRDRYGSSTAFTPRVRHIVGLRTNDSVGDTDRTPFAFEAFDPLSADENRNRKRAHKHLNRECRTLRTHIARRKVHRHSLRASALFQLAHVGLVRRRAATSTARAPCASSRRRFRSRKTSSCARSRTRSRRRHRRIHPHRDPFHNRSSASVSFASFSTTRASPR